MTLNIIKLDFILNIFWILPQGLLHFFPHSRFGGPHPFLSHFLQSQLIEDIPVHRVLPWWQVYSFHPSMFDRFSKKTICKSLLSLSVEPFECRSLQGSLQQMFLHWLTVRVSFWAVGVTIPSLTLFKKKKNPTLSLLHLHTHFSKWIFVHVG